MSGLTAKCDLLVDHIAVEALKTLMLVRKPDDDAAKRDQLVKEAYEYALAMMAQREEALK